MAGRRVLFAALSLVFGAGLTVVLAEVAQTDMDEHRWVAIDDPAIQYGDRPVDDPVARFIAKLDSGKAKLDYAPGPLGYLPSLLKNLDINVDSQVLVFSKTSFQNPKISPWAPRALFFNDTVAVGSVQGGDVLELAALDPKQGINFYTLDVKKASRPEFDRRSDCLQCHQGITTLGIPGVLVTSVFPSGDGTPAFRGASLQTDDRTSFSDRWGGWYVTGIHGGMRHMGNSVAHDARQPRNLDMTNSQNITSLGHRFDATNYLSPSSDIVALMTLEHQTHMIDLMIRTAWDARVELARSKGVLDDAGNARVNGDIEAMVKYMLFTEEAKIYDPVEGVSTFSKTFPQRGPRDGEGRSLRDFDLRSRMFKYPLSYMIYSETFDSMPAVVRERVYRRLYDVLSGKDTSKPFDRLSKDDRRAVLEILLETKSGLPDYWKKPA